MLVLAGQVLLGIQFRSFFEAGFDKLPRAEQGLEVTALALLLAGMALIFLPAAYHRIVEEGDDSNRLVAFVGRAAFPALLPFAAALAIDFDVATYRAIGRGPALAVALVVGVVALTFFYGMEGVALLVGRGEKAMPS